MNPLSSSDLRRKSETSWPNSKIGMFATMATFFDRSVTNSSPSVAENGLLEEEVGLCDDFKTKPDKPAVAEGFDDEQIRIVNKVHRRNIFGISLMYNHSACLCNSQNLFQRRMIWSEAAGRQWNHGLLLGWWPLKLTLCCLTAQCYRIWQEPFRGIQRRKSG